MVKTNYSGLNPVVVQALTNLHYRYSNETPKMWCSHIRVSFRKLIEYNPIFFSKNEYIHITERLYKDGEFRPEKHLHPTNEFKEKIHRFINSAIAIQRIWRAFKLGPETWVQRVWNIVRNDGTPDRKRFLGELPSFQRIIINPETQEEYALRVGEFVDGFMKNCIYIENFNLAELVTPGPRTILK
uniref:Uncharacterized protein n=1 Tax=Rhizophagus irregularis (strain DAOM 181602 / DAOM 197198 / MUCL 43194) TaxID=747089 RepID=U9U8Q2_RHIID